MHELFGQVFSIAKKHPPVEGCTISKSVNQRENAIFYFSLAENTDISAEIFPYHKFIYVLEGSVTICQQLLKTGDSILTPCQLPRPIKGPGLAKGPIPLYLSVVCSSCIWS